MAERIKTITAYIVLIALLFGIFPSELFANPQAPVSSGVILTYDSSSSAGYGVNVSWYSPAINTSDPRHDTEGFDIEIENTVTKDKENPEEVMVKGGESAGSKYDKTITKALKDGFLYRYSVMPYHFHTTKDNNGNDISVKAPMDIAKTSNNEAFFLTDIKAEGTGAGDSMTVIWDNPSDLIRNYKISYRKITSDSNAGSSEWKTVNIDLDQNKDEVEILNDKVRKGTRYSYTITNKTAIAPANMYDVIIEPVFNEGTYIKGESSLTENGRKIPVTAVDNGANSGKYPCIVATNLPLEVEEIDANNIKLTWPALDQATIDGTKQLDIQQNTNEDFDKDPTTINTLYGEGCNLGFMTIPKPKTKTYYRLQVTFNNSDDGKERPPMFSIIVEFSPTMVPFTPNKPTILQVKPISKSETAYELDMTWSAFIRAPYDETEMKNTENNDGKTYVDKDITYDIWISDDVSGVYNNKVMPILADLSPKTLNNVIFTDKDNNEIIAYNTILPQYSKKTETGYETSNILPNKLYYIKIVTKKIFKVNGKDKEFISQPEYLLVYFNEAGNIFLPPMMSKPPLKVKKDDKGKEMIGKTDVTVEWKKSWWEIYNPDKDEWESKFKVENGKVVFGFEGEGISIKSEEEMKNKVLALISDSIYYRPINLDDNIKYELMVVPYIELEKFAKDNYSNVEQVAKEKIYDDYIKKELLPKETPTTSIFTEITDPAIDPTDTEKNTLYTTISGLTPNTEYVILFRAFRTITDEVRLKSDPSYITITTLPIDTEISEIPTVPSLYLKEKDDISITVKWRDDGFKYEIIISEKPTTDLATATKISSEEIEKNGQKIIKDTEIGADAMYYKIEGLFPDTQYYIWIRAISDTAPEPSAWSSPLQVSTNPLEKPKPPAGLGLASKQSLLYINDADKKQYVPANEKYLILEWMKDVKDTSEGYTSTITGDAGMLGAPEVKSSMLAIYQNLVSNKWFYVRVATRVVVVKDGDKGIRKTFSYVVQLADNEEFTDAIEIEIPTKFELGEGDTYRMEISDFCTPKKFLTSPSGNEYDGDVDPSLYPLPTEDFEIIYDSVTDTLTYRLRSNEIGKDGMPDNRVDQRVITKLIQKGLYTFSIDVSKYNNKLVANRIVEVPYTLLDSFRQKRIDIKIKADNMTLILKSNWLPDEQARTLAGFGDSSKLKITMNQNVNLTTATKYYPNPIQYISAPQQLNLTLQTPKSTNNIIYTAVPMSIQMKLDNRTDIYDKNIAPYIYNTLSSEWERLDGDYDSQTAQLEFTTNKIAAYTAFAVAAPVSSESSESFKSISNKINITDMRNYKASQSITANQLSNLIYSVAKDKKDVTLNKSLTDAEKSELTKSSLALTKTGDSGVSRQEAINSIVKLYERKLGAPIKANDSSNISDMNAVSSVYQTNMLKAETLGFLKNETLARPNDEITIDEAAYMINLLLEDTM